MSAARRSASAGVARLRRFFLLIAILLVVGVIVGVTGFDIGGTIGELTLPLRHDDIIRQQAAEKGVPADLIAAPPALSHPHRPRWPRRAAPPPPGPK